MDNAAKYSKKTARWRKKCRVQWDAPGFFDRLKFVVHSHPVGADGLAESGDRLVAGIHLVLLQRFQTFKLADQYGVVVPRAHIPGHLAFQKLGDHTLEGGKAALKLLLLGLGAGTEFPHYNMSDHLSLSSLL